MTMESISRIVNSANSHPPTFRLDFPHLPSCILPPVPVRNPTHRGWSDVKSRSSLASIHSPAPPHSRGRVPLTCISGALRSAWRTAHMGAWDAPVHGLREASPLAARVEHNAALLCNVSLSTGGLHRSRTRTDAAAMSGTAPRTSVKLRGVGEAAARRRAAALDRQRQHRQCLVANARRLAVFPVRTLLALPPASSPTCPAYRPSICGRCPDGVQVGADWSRRGSRRRRVRASVHSEGAPHGAPTRRPHPRGRRVACQGSAETAGVGSCGGVSWAVRLPHAHLTAGDTSTEQRLLASHHVCVFWTLCERAWVGVRH
jgi:hypothetical protein